MKYRPDIASDLGLWYDTWRVKQLARRENRHQRRLKRRAERDEALAHRLEQAELAAAYKAKVAAAKFGKKVDRDQQRGYSVDYKRVLIASCVELVIAANSLYGQYLLAVQYGHDSLATTQLMILAPVAYAIAELCRVPMAISVRTHRQPSVRLLALLGVIATVPVTVKSLSQLGNMTYAPRQADVVVAHEKLDSAQDADNQIGQLIANAQALVDQRSAELRSAVEKEKEASAQVAGLPKPVCRPASWFDRRTRTVIQKTICTPDSRGTSLTNNLGLAQLDTKNAQAAHETALTELKKLDRAPTSKALDQARTAYREALRNSQLNDFASMVWGISPVQVTEAMVAQFLRWFVFGASICVAFSSTLIAFTAITRVKPAKPATVTLDDLHEDILKETLDALNAEKDEAKTNRATKGAESDGNTKHTG